MIEAISDFIHPFLGPNRISEIIPHTIAWLFYAFAALLFSGNLVYINTGFGSHPMKTALNAANTIALSVCLLFIGIQMYWIRYSVISEDPTTMAMLWTTFHYYNGVSYITYACGMFAYLRWRTTGETDDRMPRRRKSDWM